jgi:hypothetical protein
MGKCVSKFEDTSRNFDDIKNSLKTGDIVLFSGESEWSNIIKVATDSNWSHVGMIVKTNRLNNNSFIRNENDEDENLYLWHSTDIPTGTSIFLHDYSKINHRINNNINDFVQEINFNPYFCKSGVQLNPLDYALKSYRGKIAIRPLVVQSEKWEKMIEDNLIKILPWMKNESPKLYEQDYMSMLNAAKSSNMVSSRYDNSTDSYFCSELTTHTYIKLNLLFEKVNPEAITPKMFSTENDLINDSLRMKTNNQIYLDKEIFLSFNKF